MRVLITGGGGFIGRAVQRALREQGHTFELLDHPDDVRDEMVVTTRMYGCEVVIHLAGLLGTHELFDNPAEAVDVNIIGTVNVLEACRKHSTRYVGISMPPVFPSIYTATKMAAGHFAHAYNITYDVPVSQVVAFNAYGPGQKYGDGHPQKIIPTFASRAWAGEPIPIWGDGTQTVDLIHVDDLGKMLAEAARLNGVTLDGGSGKALTVNEVADFVLAITGSKAGIEYHPMRRGEIPTEIVATGEGWEKLAWRPEFSWSALAETVRSYRPIYDQRPNMAKPRHG